MLTLQSSKSGSISGGRPAKLNPDIGQGIFLWHPKLWAIKNVFSVNLVCKEELNLMLNAIGHLIKVRGFELRGTDSFYQSFNLTLKQNRLKL